ncbi:hypothetical protein VII00023_07239 [Vibrio ichthyoenteri ATCC 700023]|uniref:Uncharacterized protein n=2 Tax=Vibrio TaxID=662 RepID=F9S2V9_9VIBR|nr:hypothetical protein VSVS05_04439 [Vibrio scophthalmi]EGU38833.1 hypothetical protein VII00023_07239 [Vibrio ichthyoenteri ATCC 700023]
MDVFVVIVIGVAAYCIIDRLCVHRERMKEVKSEEGNE